MRAFFLISEKARLSGFNPACFAGMSKDAQERALGNSMPVGMAGAMAGPLVRCLWVARECDLICAAPSPLKSKVA